MNVGTAIEQVAAIDREVAMAGHLDTGVRDRSRAALRAALAALREYQRNGRTPDALDARDHLAGALAWEGNADRCGTLAVIYGWLVADADAA